MNDNQRNNFSFESEIEVMPQLIDSTSSDYLAIHFSHNYYSTDSEYGYSVLRNYAMSLVNNSEMKFTLMLSDTAVKLLEDSEFIHMFYLISFDRIIYVSESAVINYSVNLPDELKIELVSDSDFMDLLISYKPIQIS